jgi:hypothetical protein
MRTSRNGEDPKKKKSTWEDVAKNEEIKASNKASQDKYKSESDVYEKQVKAYASQPKNRDLKSHFQGGGRYLSPSELDVWNKDMEASGLAKERGGLKANKVYVTKDFGKEGSVSSLKTATGKSYSGGMGSFHEWLDKPTKKPSPTPPISEIEIKKTDLSVGRLPLKKPGKIAAKTTGPLRMSERAEPAEKPNWQDPSKSEYKSKSRFKTARNAVFNSGGDGMKLGSAKVEQKSSKESRIGGYAREGKMAKAYFGGGFENQPSVTIAESRDVLRKDKAEFKSGIKEARKAGDKEKVAAYRASKKDINTEIKQTKLASKYLGKLGKEYTGVREGEELRSTGKIKAYTPEAMAGFTGSKQDTYNSDANFNKFLAKNAVNNNKTFGRKVKIANKRN